MKRRVIDTADLFCGAGGATTGLELALRELGFEHRGFAVNHWRVAVETMLANHPNVRPVQSTVESVVPAEAIPGGKLDLLWASPSCTHHSRAKGGKPVANQLRAQPELILTWLDQLYVRRLIVENVPEIIEWGPIGANGRPLPSMAGSCFRAWVEAIRARNYDVEFRILNCADYGDATTRRRFFLQAVRKGCGSITWPTADYSESGESDLFGPRRKWRGIASCIDWHDLGQPISGRKRPLAENTMRRIKEGVRKFCGDSFIFDFFKNMPTASCFDPIGAQTTHDRFAIATPFLVDFLGTENPECGNRLLQTSNPLPTIHAGGNRFGLATPFIIPMEHSQRAALRDVSRPIPTVTTAKGGAFGLAVPFVMGKQSNPCMRRVDEPSPTITTAGSILLCTPMTSGKSVVDVFFRMLKPEELARAHSFPDDYKLTGTKSDQIRQIGNSVPVQTAKALCLAALGA